MFYKIVYWYTKTLTLLSMNFNKEKIIEILYLFLHSPSQIGEEMSCIAFNSMVVIKCHSYEDKFVHSFNIGIYYSWLAFQFTIEKIILLVLCIITVKYLY